MGPGFANWLAGLVGELVLARSVRDVAATFEVAAGDARGPAPEAADRALPERPRVGLVLPVGFAEAERAAARSAAEAAADATGGRVVAMDAECWSALGAGGAGSAVLAASSAEWIDALEISDEELSPLVAAVARAGRAVSGPQIVGALRDMARAAHALWGLFDEVDAIVSPVLADGPPEVRAFDFGSDDVAAHFAKMAAVAPGAGLANATGAPALVLPFGMAGGLPRGVQVMAPPGADRALLGLAAKIEAAAGPLPFPAIAGAPA
jgi:amidase